MKRILLIILIVSFVVPVINAQVIADFEESGDFESFEIKTVEDDGGTALDTIYQTTDPTGNSVGVLSMHFNFTITDKGIVNTSTSIDPNGAQLFTFWIYLPENIPDSIAIGLFAMDNSNFSWKEVTIYAIDIPKQKWYPLSFPLTQTDLKSEDFDLQTAELNEIGIQISNYNNNDIWEGIIYLDNVSLIGAKPNSFADFDSGIEGFTQLWNNGWNGVVSLNPGSIGDSTGILEIELTDGSSKTGGYAAGIEPIGGLDRADQNFLVFWVYLNTTFPDSGYFQVFAQDNNLWEWPGPAGIITYYGFEVPKEIWYPLYFDLSQASIMDTIAGSSFNHLLYNIGKFGLQVDAESNFTGKVYINQVQFINSVTDEIPVEEIWVAANFQVGSTGLQGFYVPDSADGTISKLLDIANPNKTYVLRGNVDFSAPNHQFVLMRDTIPLIDEDDSGIWANRVTFEMFLPGDIPSGGLVRYMIKSRLALYTWNYFNYNIDGVDLIKNSWNVLRINIDSLVNEGLLDPTVPADLAVQIYYPAPNDTVNWVGTLRFDDLTFYGISRTQQLQQVLVSVTDDKNIVKEFKLYNNYPNPFNPSTNIKYDLPAETDVVLKIYDILGKEVATLVNEKQKSGRYNLNFNASDFASGLYIYRIITSNYIKSEKMLLLK